MKSRLTPFLGLATLALAAVTAAGCGSKTAAGSQTDVSPPNPPATDEVKKLAQASGTAPANPGGTPGTTTGIATPPTVKAPPGHLPPPVPTGKSVQVPADNIVGTWKDGNGTPLTFKKDNTFSGDIEPPKDPKNPAYKLKQHMDGTYKVEGSNITLTIKTVSFTATDPSVKKKAEDLQAMVSKSPNVHQSNHGTLFWNSKDDGNIVIPSQIAGGPPHITPIKRVK